MTKKFNATPLRPTANTVDTASQVKDETIFPLDQLGSVKSSISDLKGNIQFPFHRF